ncbi:class I SAM-dependent methyltransferase [Candidatus Saccharibacteria bacterium]|nr:class I SAM-dependent methyltransferase [Candidatus Saccharibacteria bacterium]
MVPVSIESLRRTPLPDEENFRASKRFLDDNEFYVRGSNAELERLNYMATIADAISVDEITRLMEELACDRPIVVDIGAGDSASLGHELSAAGVIYVPVDIRQDAVESQRAAGYNAIQSAARNIDISPETVDLVHSRFTWGWLNDDEREHSLVEMLRITKEDAGLALIDYDWSAVTGPQVFLDAVRFIQDAMKHAGFDPNFGRIAKQDISDRLDRMLINGVKVMITERREPVYIGEIQHATQIIEKTAIAVSAQLRQIGLSNMADGIDEGFAALTRYIDERPHETVTLPDVVSVGVSLHHGRHNLSNYAKSLCEQHSSLLERLREQEEQAFAAGSDYSELCPGVTSMASTGVASAPSLILAARRVQAEAYVKDGIVGSEAIGYDGALIVENDPVELVNRSEYLVSIGKGRVRGVVRIIEPNAEGKESLPTVARLRTHSPQAWQELLKHPAMASSEKLIEVSALAKDASVGGFVDVMRAILALVVHAQSPEQGYRYGIMGLQKTHVPLISSVFGEQNFQQLVATDATHAIELPGVKNDVKFVPLIVDGQKFVTRAHEHARVMHQKLGPERGKLFAMLRDITAEILANNSHL